MGTTFRLKLSENAVEEHYVDLGVDIMAGKTYDELVELAERSIVIGIQAKARTRAKSKGIRDTHENVGSLLKDMGFHDATVGDVPPKTEKPRRVDPMLAMLRSLGIDSPEKLSAALAKLTATTE